VLVSEHLRQNGTAELLPGGPTTSTLVRLSSDCADRLLACSLQSSSTRDLSELCPVQGELSEGEAVERMFAVKKLYLVLTAVLVAAGTSAVAVAKPVDVTPLNNKDVVAMVEQKLGADTIVKAIKTSPCTFDTFPSVMKELKRRGVPDEVLQAMIDAPYGPAEKNLSTEDLAGEPIYHYTEHIKQFLAPVNTGRRYNPAPARARAARTRIRR